MDSSLSASTLNDMKQLLTIPLILALAMGAFAGAQEDGAKSESLHQAAAKQLVSVQDSKLEKHELTKQPDYYVVYHSASW